MRRHSSPRLAVLSAQILALIALVAFVAGAAAQQGAEDPAVTVHMKDAKGNGVGTVEVKQLAQGVLFVADLKNLPPGGHAFHVHQHGKCKPSFDAAGSHYSPLDNKHGLDNKQGYHVGDLPNVHVSKQGTGKAEFFVHRFMLGMPLKNSGANATGDSIPPVPPAGMQEGPFPLLDEDGSAIIIHQNPDDYEAQPPDSSGPRIACGVIETSN